MKQTQRTEQTDILKQIEQGKIYPIYLLCGEEEFLVDKELTGMLELLVPGEARDFNLEIYDGIGISVDEIITSAETYPVMAERRVTVGREATFFPSTGGSSFK
ncbi:MAG: hypothetical protein H8D67_03355, partial [Deltaproteobacteria bacterium]|nr:hypothetical protein [Deltaproteobacteria bacterium]